MKTFRAYRLSGILAAFAVCLISLSGSGTAAAEQGYIERIAKTLEGSALTKAEQAEVRVQAESAVKTGIPVDDVELIVMRAAERGADAETVSRLLHIPMSAKREGLPAGPVLDRIEQGLSKGVSPARIAAASERLAEKLAAARPVVDGLVQKGLSAKGSGDRETAISSAARALEKGVPADALHSLGAVVHEQRGSLRYFSSAVDTTAYFAGSGMTAGTAARLVRHAVEKGYAERDLDAMVRQLDSEMKRGTRAEDAAARMDRETMQGGQGAGRQGVTSGQGGGSGAGSGRGSGPGTGGAGGPRR